MKKFLSKIILLLIIILGIGCIYNCCEAASENAKFSVSSSTGKIGEQVSVDVNLNNSSNFTSANLVLNYDATNLEFISYESGEVLETGAMSIVKDNSEVGKIAMGYVANPEKANEIIQPGNIVKIVFKIKGTKVEENSLELECTSLKDDSGEEVTRIINNGKIKVVNSNNTTNENQSNNTNKNETTLPNAGINEKYTVVLIYLVIISMSIILYKKYKFIKDIN